MNSSRIIFAVFILFHLKVQADDLKASEPFSVRLYKAPELQKNLSEQPLPEGQSGVMVDYFPFANGFHVSAGTFQDEKERTRSGNVNSNGRTYIGVGWKKLLDDARQLDLNIDVGTYIDASEAEWDRNAPKLSDGSPRLNGGDLDAEEKPVIRFGLEFRF